MIKSLVIPHRRNNYRPHAIRWYGIVTMCILLLILQVVRNYQITGQAQVLAFATNTTVSGLLAETNANRVASGLAPLSLSGSLNSAAQSKAQHMIDNNYWAHVAPDGTTPWDFINGVGYQYLKAGENLAFGFATSSSTVVGWMGSPTHRANILDPAYETVGFGIVNGPNFQGGENTVVVALYADPVQSQSSGGGSGSSNPTPPATPPPSTPAPSPTEPSTPAPSTPTQATPAPTQNPTEPTTAEVEEPEEEVEQVEDLALTPATINYQVSSTTVTNFEALFNGQAHWTLYAMTSILGVMALIYSYRHVLFVRNIVIKGEHLMHDHPLLEASIIYAVLWFTLSASFGVTL